MPTEASLGEEWGSPWLRGDSGGAARKGFACFPVYTRVFESSLTLLLILGKVRVYVHPNAL